MRTSHILCKVNDLHEAVETYRSLGFEVELGDDPAKTINALIWFERGPFLELIDVEGARPPVPVPWMERFDRWRDRPEGWCDVCLETDGDFVPVADRLRAAGIEVAGPFVGQRMPPGGNTVQTQTGFPYDAQLPFAMGEYQPNPRPSRVVHKNGATGIAKVVVAVDAAAQSGWDKLLDADDPWLDLRPETSGFPLTVESVTLTGLARDIPPERAHGAVFQSA